MLDTEENKYKKNHTESVVHKGPGKIQSEVRNCLHTDYDVKVA